MNDFLRTIVPTIATALGGPLAGVAVNFLAEKLNVEASTELIQAKLSGMSGTELVQLKSIETEFTKFLVDSGIKIQQAQIATNQVEAASDNWVKSYWRPLAGWAGVVGLWYISFVEPAIRFYLVVFNGHVGAFPIVDTSVTMQVLFGMLGLGAMRSFEKTHNGKS
jgi:hypothetical protein